MDGTEFKVNERILKVSDLERISKLKDIYEGYKRWDWRFGETPQFTNQIEKKFDWAMMDIEFNVEKGVIKSGVCFSDCLIPAFIDELNEVLKSGTITYDESGAKQIGQTLADKFQDNEAVIAKFIPELV